MIRQNDFKRQWGAVEDDVLSAIRLVGASGWYILGEEVAAFETAIAEFWGVRHAVGVGNGMDALEIALRCQDIRPGEQVITTPFSAFASTLPILRTGGLPVFVDDRGGIDLEQCRVLLAQNRSIRFLLPVHLYGYPVDLVEFSRLKEEFEICHPFLTETEVASVVEACNGWRPGTSGG